MAFKKGIVPWNKGKKPSAETRKKSSESHKGQIAWNKGIACSEETKAKISKTRKGQPSWNKGRQMSEETKAKLSLANKGQIAWNKGTKGIMPVGWNKGLTLSDPRIKRSAEKQKITKKLNGTSCLEKNGRWKDGRAAYRNLALKHYGKKCMDCGQENNNQRKIHVHHIDKNKLNNKLSNLIVLCPKCHKKRHPQRQTEKQKRILSKLMKGVPKSENHKRKLSEAKKRQWAEGVYNKVKLGRRNRG